MHRYRTIGAGCKARLRTEKYIYHTLLSRPRRPATQSHGDATSNACPTYSGISLLYAADCCTFSPTPCAFRALQVFVMTGWYPCVKKALLERGWTQNLDRDSPFFDLKWTLHSQDIRTTDIQPWQLCNHFFKVCTRARVQGHRQTR